MDAGEPVPVFYQGFQNFLVWDNQCELAFLLSLVDEWTGRHRLRTEFRIIGGLTGTGISEDRQSIHDIHSQGLPLSLSPQEVLLGEQEGS